MFLSSLKPMRGKVKTKMEGQNLSFKIKTVTEKTVKKGMNKMQKKKSLGTNGVSQECLQLGKDVLAIPLKRIINTSITVGKFPDKWKESIVLPLIGRSFYLFVVCVSH